MKKFKSFTDEQIVNMVSQRYTYSRDCKKFQNKIVKKNIQLYRSYIDEKNWTHKSKIFVPYTYMLIESVTPRIMQAIFNNRPILRAKPRDADQLQHTDKITNILDYSFDNCRFFDKAEMWSRNTSITGTGIGLAKWVYEVEEKLPDDIFEGLEDTDDAVEDRLKPYVRRDEPDFEVISYWDYFPDPELSNEWCIIRSVVSLDNLEETNSKFKVYKDLDKLVGTDASYEEEEYLAFKGQSSTNKSLKDPYKDNVELLTFWDKDSIFIVANRTVCIRRDNNVYKKVPVIEIPAIPIDKERWGESIIQPIEKLQHYMNGMKSMRFDMIAQAIQPMWKVNTRSPYFASSREMVWSPNKILPVNGMDEIDAIRPNLGALQDSLMEEQNITGIIQRTTGITDYILGMQGRQKNETATAVSMLTEAATAKILLFIQRFGTMGLRELGYRFLEMYRNFSDEDIIFRKFSLSKEEMFDQIGTEALHSRYSLDLVEGMFYAAEVRQRQIAELFQMLYDKREINNREIVRTLLDNFDLKNTDDIVKTEEQIQQEQAALMREMIRQEQEEQMQAQAQQAPEGEGEMM